MKEALKEYVVRTTDWRGNKRNWHCKSSTSANARAFTYWSLGDLVDIHSVSEWNNGDEVDVTAESLSKQT